MSADIPTASTFQRIIGWVIGAAFVCTALGVIGEHPVKGILLIICALLLIPPTARRIEKSGLVMSRGSRIFVYVIGIGLMLNAAVQAVSNRQVDVREAATQTAPTETVAPASTPPAAVPTTGGDTLEDTLKNLTDQASVIDADYRAMKIEKADSDRPKGTQIVTVSVTVRSFLNRNSLLKNTGKLSSQMFQSVFNASDQNAHDVFIWYYGETTDRYGNKKEDVVMTYAMDKSTYEKINWQNFDQSTLCDFLNAQAKTGRAADTACIVLADIR